MKKFALAAILLLFASSALAANWPPELPQNFEAAPKTITCVRIEPTSIHWKYHFHPQERWRVITWGKDGRDILMHLIRRDKQSKKESHDTWVAEPGGWKSARTLTQKEMRAWEKNTHYTDEEMEFIASCAAKQL
ncbi:MAG: hypothetical protein WAP51_00910 [Candidatus Sungiibacteriota bacterium]